MLRPLGQGGNGVVYLARQLAVDRIVACKILHPHQADDPVYVRNFVHEARLAARLEHPNIIQSLDVGCRDGVYYLMMEYVPGVSLEKIRTAAPERITLSFLLNISISLAEALDHAWRTCHIFHGDIKPDNLMIRDPDGVLKLADLGLAKIVGTDDLATDIMATPLYAAPEVITADAGNIGIKSDIYSSGIMLYELLAGKAPFSGNIESVLRQHLEEIPPPLGKINPAVDRTFAALVDKMISKSPADRPRDWAVIREELLEIRKRISRDPGAGRPLRRLPEKEEMKKNLNFKHFISILFSLLLLLLAGAVAFVLFKAL